MCVQPEPPLLWRRRCPHDEYGAVDVYGCWRHRYRRTPCVTKQAFTFQMSDHFRLWVQVNTDIDAKRLDQIIQS